MKILFLYPNSRTMSLIPPSIALFSALLKRTGHEVALFDTTFYRTNETDSNKADEDNLTVHPAECEEIEYEKGDVYEDFNKKIKEFEPQLIAATATDSTYPFAVKLLESIDDLESITMLGGTFATFAPERALENSCIDYVCVGEGEETILEMCDRIENDETCSGIPNLWSRGGLPGQYIRGERSKPVKIDTFPPLDISIFEPRRLNRAMGGKVYHMLPVETHRGCPFQCTYCASPTLNKMYDNKFYRKKPIRNVGNILWYYKDIYDAEYFFFWADTFFAYSNDEIKEFCEMYKHIRLPFYVQARPETITEEKIERLKDVGLDRIGVGIECGNEEYRSKMLKRYYTNKQAIDAMAIVHKHKIKFSLNNIIGLPDETRELVFDTIELNRQIEGFDDASCSIFQPYYGTPLRQYCIEIGYIQPRDLAPNNSEPRSILTMPQFSKEEISGLQRTFAMYIRLPKNHWDLIKIAETDDKVWSMAREDLMSYFFNKEKAK